MNEFFIGAQGDHLVFLIPVPQKLTKDQTVLLAAWLVAIANPTRDAFDQKLKQIQTS